MILRDNFGEKKKLTNGSMKILLGCNNIQVRAIV